ncbi:hypothetical protein B0H67DRAFT_149849 [Lasiosphaeris hirsuta]|uniref:Alpha-ketoglutarate-dependent sulfonate dioxygenase n=1 Tax=Lasiosphaeris hirsuta TaxID=260670 RepID=A0AA40ANW0_9PEZI|nr:hypothetical protein B0H67DRAFT_149849 [Lasiosphaeris hirsuta]
MSKRASLLSKVAVFRPSGRTSVNNLDDAQAPPPAYDAFENDQAVADGRPPPEFAAAVEAETANLTAAFDDLKLIDGPSSTNADSCLAHLKLLYAIQSMKEDVGYTDGLWGLWNTLAGPVDLSEKSPEERMKDRQLETLSQIREKRWALFVARAVDRYAAWWQTLPGKQLTEQDMESADSEAYIKFADSSAVELMEWTEDMLPPLDVLMVWHTHMLNPRSFLEDSILAGLRSLWMTGMPWALVNAAINSDFAYSVSDDAKVRWAAKTGLSWENVGDPLIKTLRCPRCNTSLQVPWTTCGMPEDYNGDDLDLGGNGYGDGDLHYSCTGCTITLCKELLSVAKFVTDVRTLIGPSNRPMPGTVLDPRTGMPEAPPPDDVRRKMVPRTFPNRLLKSGLNSIRTKMVELITSNSIEEPSMQDVRVEIEQILANKVLLGQLDGFSSVLPGIKYQPTPTARMCIRKMMSRYWENSSIFALDLAGAVMRQGVFIEKMYKLDWLHSPSARDTMQRLITKYKRFIGIMKTFKDKVAVPTLDVDLAWHTHQLSPSAYYTFAVSETGKFINHDDKIPEDTLSVQFEWTSRVYQDLYGEVYSECTCWYCEGT